MSYTYDSSTVPFAKGRLTQVSDGVSTTKILSYDTLGRVTGSSQSTGVLSNLAFSYKYDLAGNLQTETYPSGRIVTACHDSVGRVSSVAGQSSSTAASVTYAAGPSAQVPLIHYTAHGALDQMKLGNGLFESSVFNGELQPTSVNLGSTNLASDVWGVVNGYGTSNNNGNLLSQAISAKGMTAVVNQFFVYGGLNR